MSLDGYLAVAAAGALLYAAIVSAYAYALAKDNGALRVKAAGDAKVMLFLQQELAVAQRNDLRDPLTGQYVARTGAAGTATANSQQTHGGAGGVMIGNAQGKKSA